VEDRRGTAREDPIRRAFLDDRRESSRRRYDELHAATYDREWGAISPTHHTMLGRLLDLTAPRGRVLDVACGTGKYWDVILLSDRSVFGIDHSLGMLTKALEKHPEIPTSVTALQDLDYDGSFDAAICIDAMENVGPEDWPEVLTRLRRAVRVGSPVYLTIEQPDEDLERSRQAALERGDPVVPGESFDGVAYHYFPSDELVDTWIRQAGLEVSDDLVGDWYRHLLLRRPD
jgi:cyclopropane fatty-acyl-phospholipid synthase-like methyltransferase